MLIKRLFVTIVSVTILCSSAGCSVIGVNSVEEANYRVIKKEDDFELREYSPLVVAETNVNAEFKKAGRIAFRRLFAYISGDNRKNQKIAMTAPVIADAAEVTGGEEIKMTAPVIGESNGNSWRYRFVLPASYSIDSAPVPLNDDVRVSTVPGKTVAVIRFSGLVNSKDIQEKSAELSRWMTANNLVSVSEPRWAGYDPPWTIPFFRRNEVMIDISD
jgi:hypothetical protein